MIDPPPNRNAGAWADANRVLPPESPEPGPWRSRRIPYFEAPIEAFRDPRYTMIVVVCGSQMGKTETQFNILGHRLDDGPFVPCLYIAPTQKAAASIAGDRFRKMLRSTPSLWQKLEKGKRDSKMEKFIAGVRLGFGWAGSATELASHPAGLVMVDERSRMDADIANEGDPVYLAMARTKNYPGRKIGVFSTPTIEGICPTWALFLEGTKHRWAWCCPHCQDYFVVELKQLKWPNGCTPSEAHQHAYLECPRCQGAIDNSRKAQLNRSGRYLPHQLHDDALRAVEVCAPNPTASFHISGLASPWQSFGDIAQVLVAAYRSHEPEKIQTAINTYGGEPWRTSGEAPKWRDVYDRRGHYAPRTVPAGVQFITCGIDVQKEKLVYAIRGWGFNAESWLLDFGEIWGNTAYDEPYLGAARLLHHGLGHLHVRRGFIDSGYRPTDGFRRPENQIYLFCRRERQVLRPAKGHDTQDKPLKPSMIDVSLSGKVIQGGLQLWHIDTDHFKTWLHARIEWPEDQPGGWHTHAEISEDYARQICAEEVITKASGRRQWLVKYANHYLDCEVLNAAAAHSLNVHALRPLPVEPSEPATVTPARDKPRQAPLYQRHGL